MIIDSPLIVYREPDNDEDIFPHEVEDALHEGIAADFSDVQVIIFENDNASNSVQASANVVTFTGSNQGRAGFISRAGSTTCVPTLDAGTPHIGICSFDVDRDRAHWPAA
ncbi:hypothetical protein [Melittangium boletus]|uniref:hypothetical protein n=1 Tax=Melittangium boletus TaxID=83453 RepID=UPI003DA5B525